MVGLGRDGVQQVSARDDGGPAFPVPKLDEDHEIVGVNSGMALRDVFAAHAMQAIIAKAPTTYGLPGDAHCPCLRVALGAYDYADAMLAARKQP